MATRGKGIPEKEFAPDDQEIYVDSAQVQTGLYGSTIFLGVLRQDQPPLVKTTIKVSPQMLRVLGLILSKHARGYTDQFGPISLPNQLFHELGLEDEIK